MGAGCGVHRSNVRDSNPTQQRHTRVELSQGSTFGQDGHSREGPQCGGSRWSSFQKEASRLRDNRGNGSRDPEVVESSAGNRGSSANARRHHESKRLRVGAHFQCQWFRDLLAAIHFAQLRSLASGEHHGLGRTQRASQQCARHRQFAALSGNQRRA